MLSSQESPIPAPKSHSGLSEVTNHRSNHKLCTLVAFQYQERLGRILIALNLLAGGVLEVSQTRSCGAGVFCFVDICASTVMCHKDKLPSSGFDIFKACLHINTKTSRCNRADVVWNLSLRRG